MLRGIGTIRASALVAALASSSRVVPLRAWMLGPPQKPGQGYGARSAARTARKLDQYRGGICSSGSAWLEERVALANKNARILWAMQTKDVRFNADHVSERGQPLAGTIAGMRLRRRSLREACNRRCIEGQTVVESSPIVRHVPVRRPAVRARRPARWRRPVRRGRWPRPCVPRLPASASRGRIPSARPASSDEVPARA